MVGSRLLGPTFGTSIYVWGSLIVVVMTALTVGYYFGGRIADNYPTYTMMGMILGAAGLFIGFLPFWAQTVNNSFSMLEPRIGSLLASVAFFLVPGILLATISPYGIKLASSSLTTIGNTAGHMAAISSAGSIMGTLLTSFFLIPAMGVHHIIHSLGAILLIISVFVLFKGKSGIQILPESGRMSSKYFINLLISLVLFGLILLIALWTVIPNTTRLHPFSYTLYDRDSLYQHITVDQIGDERHLHFDDTYQSAMFLHKPLEMVFPYTSYLHLGVVAHPQPSRALFIGLGGGSAPKKFLHDYASLKTIDIVDIDAEIAKVARRYFNLPYNPRLRVTVQDGRLFIKKKARDIAAGRAEPYDLIVIDAYSASSIPYHLTTIEFLAAVRATLSSNGVVVSNIIGACAGPYSQLLRSMKRTFDAVFPQNYLFPVGGWSGPDDSLERNVILVATTNPEHWDAERWTKEAQSLYESGAVSEDVPQYAQMLADDILVRGRTWLAGTPLLTDDYAPVDTLKNPI